MNVPNASGLQTACSQVLRTCTVRWSVLWLSLLVATSGQQLMR